CTATCTETGPQITTTSQPGADRPQAASKKRVPQDTRSGCPTGRVLSIICWPDLLQLDRPVGVLQEALPRLILALRELQVQHRAALRLLRLADQRQTSLPRRATALADVAGHAGADDVLPRCLAALAARRDVVEAQLARRELLAAILALVVVASEDVPAIELHR